MLGVSIIISRNKYCQNAIVPTNHHQPVLFLDAIEALNIDPCGNYIDGTFGRGGHSQGVLDKLGNDGRLLAFDRDLDAVLDAKKHFSDPRFEIVHSAFSKMQAAAKKREMLGQVDGILLDLGVSSPQLDRGERGFSFNQDGALDMRMDRTTGISVAEWLAGASEVEIADVLYQYGEEKRSRQIARDIKKYQEGAAITTTLELVNIIKKTVKIHNKHPATRSFAALRIFINHELDELGEVLATAESLLKKGGRLAVISFHSLEDRIVKRFIYANSHPKPTPKKLPILDRDLEMAAFKSLGKKFASKAEINTNPRARSAILRVAEKC